MDNIEQQAKNEVEELLRDLVVSPISESITQSLSDVTKEISALSKKSEGLSFKLIEGLVKNKTTKITNDIESSKNEVLDKITENIINKINNINEITDRQTEISKKVSQNAVSLDSMHRMLNDLKFFNIEMKKKLRLVDFGILLQIQKQNQELYHEITKLTTLYESLHTLQISKSQEILDGNRHMNTQRKYTINVLIGLSVFNFLGIILLIVLHYFFS